VQNAARDTGFPVAAKPLQGTSCEGSAVFFESSEIDSFFAAPGNERAVLLVQPLVPGDAMSLSLVVSKSGKARLLSVNTQDVDLLPQEGHPEGWRKFIYRGGIAGVEENLYSRGGKWGRTALEDLGQRVVSSIPGTMGFVGVDILMTDEGPVVIEVNPRLTTPLAVAGAKAPWNLGRILLDACVNDSLPTGPAVPKVMFRKDDPLDRTF
ncbi:MAG TPA: ATP-grasp domain-containing protein, partial [Synergistetes bacterium]|nr:ATP-grasp domain-containing protein [Synergistota bacterium]